MIAEQDDTKAAALFSEGHYMQVEVAAMTKATDTPDLARQFLAFLLTDAVQEVIPTTNWMYPAALPASGLPPVYDTLPRPQKSLLLPPEEARSLRGPAIDEWLSAFSR